MCWNRQEILLMNQSLHLEDFARLFGTTVDDFDDECREFINKTNFRYTRLSPEKRDETILGVLKKIDSGQLTLAGKEGKSRWEKGWSENLSNFVAKGYDLDELIPKYVRPNQVLRLDRDYIMPVNADFELSFFTVLRLWLFKKYFKNFDSIYEFGCGPGYNLSLLAKMYPAKKLYGLDWSKAAVELVNLIGKKHNMNISGHIFDMFSPNSDIEIAENGAVMTIGGLEQLGKDHQEFVQFLIAKEPRLCIHVEPICELYEENNLVDYLAMKFHKQRNYLIGLLPYLEKLEDENYIRILKIHRMYFGSLFHDGWSLIIWRPTGGVT